MMEEKLLPLRSVFVPLTRDSYKKRCESIVPSIYLTFISIIQGVALGLLAQQLFVLAPAATRPLPKHMDLIMARGPYAFSTFLSIIIVTWEYIVLTLVHRYSYHLLDTVILFVLGFCQIAPIFFLDEPSSWWIANIFFCGVGAAAFMNERSRNKKVGFANDEIYVMVRAKLKFDIAVSLIATAWCYAATVALFGSWGAVLLGPMVIVQVSILYVERNYLSRIHAKLGIEW